MGADVFERGVERADAMRLARDERPRSSRSARGHDDAAVQRGVLKTLGLLPGTGRGARFDRGVEALIDGAPDIALISACSPPGGRRSKLTRAEPSACSRADPGILQGCW